MDLSLFDLLTPYVLRGDGARDDLEILLAALYVDRLDTAVGPDAVVLSGVAKFNVDIPPPDVGLLWFRLNATAGSRHQVNPPRSTSVFDINDSRIDFRITAIRQSNPTDVFNQGLTQAGNPALQAAVTALGVGPRGDAPTTLVRVELLIRSLSLRLPELRPARRDAEGMLVPDDTFDGVRVVLPRLLVRYEQFANGNDRISLESFGGQSLGDPSDLGVAELARMEPPYALVTPFFGFGCDRVVLDLSQEHTPPDILQKLGVGDDWQGLYLPMVQVYTAIEGWPRISVAARDLLIGLGPSAGVSMDLLADVVNVTTLKVDVAIHTPGGDRIEVGTFAPASGTQVREGLVFPQGSSVVVDVLAGVPPYDVTIDGKNVSVFTPPSSGSVSPAQTLPIDRTGAVTIPIAVANRGAQGRRVDIELRAEVVAAQGPPAPSIGDPPAVPGAVLSPAVEERERWIRLETPGPAGDAEAVVFSPVEGATVTVDGVAVSAPGGRVLVDVEPGKPAKRVKVTWAGTAGREEMIRCHFHFDKPPPAGSELQCLPSSTYVGTLANFGGSVDPDEYAMPYRDGPATWSPTLEALLRDHPIPSGVKVRLDGFASYEGVDGQQTGYNHRLSARRLEAFRQLLGTREFETPVHTGNIPNSYAHGAHENDPNAAPHAIPDGTSARARFLAATPPGTEPHYANRNYWVASARWKADGTQEVSREVELSRAPVPPVPPPPPAKKPIDLPPRPGLTSTPDFFRAAHLVIRMVRGELIAFEVRLECDSRALLQHGLARLSTDPNVIDQAQLEDYRRTPTEGGVIEAVAAASFDSATGDYQWLVRFAGKGPEGALLQWGRPVPRGQALARAPGRDAVGTFIAFGPLLAAGPVDGTNAVTEAISLMPVAAVLGATTLAVAGVFKSPFVRFRGAELMHRHRTADDRVTLLLDVETGLVVDMGFLRTPPDQPIAIRYGGLGVACAWGSGSNERPFEFVFDPKKGFALDISPGALQVDPPLDKVLQVLGARVARTNPLTLELDVGTKFDLGIVSVDRMKVRIPVDPVGPPSISAMKARVDVPGALSGSGYLSLGETLIDGKKASQIAGQIDLSIIPAGLRVAAGLAIASADDTTCVLATVAVELSTPIPLFSSGLGLYGLLGLFAMHFRRKEVAGGEMAALEWLKSVGGNPTDIAGWEPAIGRWAFGVGAVVGTLEGAKLFNLKGMLSLELPGPRVLVFANAKFLEPKKPETKSPPEGGFLAVIDLDFANDRLTVGISAHYEVKHLVRITVPARAIFNLNDAEDFSLAIGTYQQPAVADILGLVKGSAFLEIAGKGLPWTKDVLRETRGFTVAAGIKVWQVWGSESIGLYLKASAEAQVLLSFSPFFVQGKVRVAGELHVFVVGINVSGGVDIVITDRGAHLHGFIEATVELLFFELKGKIGISIGEAQSGGDPVVPKPVRRLTLQSRSPALVAGTGVDRPIDAILTVARDLDAPPPDPAKTGPVPIDSILVFELEAPPEGAVTGSLQPPQVEAPRATADGWVPRGPMAFKYRNVEVQLSPPPPAPLPSVYRADTKEPSGEDTGVELALGTLCPDATPRAFMRGRKLEEKIRRRWRKTCDPIAPAAPVLFGFHEQPFGPSLTGWRTQGLPWPDPPGTYRSAPPASTLAVREPWRSGDDLLDNATAIVPARVVGASDGRVIASPLEIFPDGEPGDPLDAAVWKLLRTDHEARPRPDLRHALRLETGPASRVRLLLVVNPEVLQVGDMRIRGCNERGDVLVEKSIPNLWTWVHTDADLPAAWNDPNGPWYSTIHRMPIGWTDRGVTILVGLDLPPDTTRIELGFPLHGPSFIGNVGGELHYYLAAAEFEFVAEAARADFDVRQRSAEISTLDGAFEAGTAAAVLLEPNETYTVTVSYDPVVRTTDADGKHTERTLARQSQRFEFKTDEQAPPSLEPWILHTNPQQDDRFHFWGEPISVTFASNDVVKLWEAYDRQLIGLVRASTFRHAAGSPTHDATKAPIALQKVKTFVRPPWEEVALKVAKKLPCVASSGDTEHHARTDLALLLDPATDYIFDIEARRRVTGDPAPPARHPWMVRAPSGDLLDLTTQTHEPLFRRHFSTSRYRDAAALAQSVYSVRVRHAVAADAASLGTAIQQLASAPSPEGFEAALRAAGVSPGAPEQPGVTVLWDASSPSRPIAVLVDALEPLRRRRLAPRKRKDPEGQTADHRHLPQVWLDVTSTGAAPVTTMAFAPDGARLFAALGAQARGELVTLELGRTADGKNPNLGDPVAEPAAVLVSVRLIAPWEVY